MAVGLLVLAGWLFDAPVLRGPIPALVEMNANTAIGLLALGVALLLTISKPSPARVLTMRLLAGLAIVLGMVTLVEYLAGRSLGLDALLFHGAHAAHTVDPGRLAPQTAIIFVCLGVALLLLHSADEAKRLLVATLTGTSFVIALFAVTGYGFGAWGMNGAPSFTPISLYTVVAFLMLCAGIAAADQNGVLVDVLRSEGRGSVVVRKLLPLSVLAFPILAWLRLQGERGGLYPDATSVALSVVVSTIVLALAILPLTKRLSRLESNRRGAAASRGHREVGGGTRGGLAAVTHEIGNRFRSRALLEEQVREGVLDLFRSRAETLHTLALAAEYRDYDTARHTERVGESAARLAAALELPAGLVMLIRQAAPLHDVGKIGIPDQILLKPGKLTSEEFNTIEQHTVLGARLLAGNEGEVMQLGEQIALTHHERWDGNGYPAGLAGEAIPIAGRVVAITDTFDAMTHDRPYRTACPVDEALTEISRCSGSQFDPRAVEAFLRLQ